MVRKNEQGTVPGKEGASLAVALVFPCSYRVGMANLGFQSLYAYLNSHPHLSAERFFFPGFPSGGDRKRGIPLSEETGRPLSHFPVIAFSIPFESDYPAVAAMLEASGIPPLQADRGIEHPIVVAGGVAVSINPEPLALIVDLIHVGEFAPEDAEEGANLFTTLAEIFDAPGTSLPERSNILGLFREAPSVYVPSAYDFRFSSDGLIEAIEPAAGYPHRVRAARRIPGQSPPPVSVLFSPEAEFGDSLLVETNRGCSRGCRFCAAGWVHFPVRYTEFRLFRNQVEKAVNQGRTIGIVGSDLAGHPQLEEILGSIVDMGGTFSLSSIRPEGLTPRVIELLAATGQKTATLAPEVASIRLKKAVGKEIPSERFYELVDTLVAHGIPNIRFYFMIGLPTETMDDIAAITEFVLESRRIFVDASRPRKRIGKMAVQVNPFVPKPWTPFQWAPMCEPKELERRIKALRDGLRRAPNLTFRAESAKSALVQGVMARGDRRISSAIIQAAKERGRLPRGAGVDTGFYALRERERDEIFPWDVVEHRVSKDRLRRVCEKALAAGRDDDSLS